MPRPDLLSARNGWMWLGLLSIPVLPMLALLMSHFSGPMVLRFEESAMMVDSDTITYLRGKGFENNVELLWDLLRLSAQSKSPATPNRTVAANERLARCCEVFRADAVWKVPLLLSINNQGSGAQQFTVWFIFLWPLLALSVVPLILWWAGCTARIVQRNQRIRSGLCPSCGYDVSHSESSRCPECGEPKRSSPG